VPKLLPKEPTEQMEWEAAKKRMELRHQRRVLGY